MKCTRIVVPDLYKICKKYLKDYELSDQYIDSTEFIMWAINMHREGQYGHPNIFKRIIYETGLKHGSYPSRTINWNKLSIFYKVMIIIVYYIQYTVSLIALATPIFIFDKLERILQKNVKNSR